MRCRKCRGKAVINMRQHRLALCKSHYLDWIVNQTERFINKYKMFSHDDRILVAVSGGKDSLALWDVIHRLGYQVDGLYLDLGIDQGVQMLLGRRRQARRRAGEIQRGEAER